VLAKWTDSEQRGHPSLFGVRADRVRRDLRGLVRAEGRLRFFAPLVPGYFELAFEAVLPGAAADGGDLHLKAVVDRIDTSSDRAVVIDYKSSRVPALKELLGPEALLTTSFQLPLYAAIARERLGLPTTSARYLSIRDAEATAELADDRRFTLDLGPGSDADPATLAATVVRIHHAMSDGDFRVAPRSCRYCELSAACRVVLRSGLDEEAGE